MSCNNSRSIQSPNRNQPFRASSQSYYNSQTKHQYDHHHRSRQSANSQNRGTAGPPLSTHTTIDESEALYRTYPYLFNKDFRFSSVQAHQIPELYTTKIWSMDRLIQLKEKLNRNRSALDDKPIEEWKRHTKRTNLTNDIVYKLRKDSNIEMCTKAWTKITELYNKYDELIPNLKDEYDNCIRFYTLHLCEGPGAMICATNHFLRQKYETNLNWHWMATTLNPYNEANDTQAMLIDDRFIVETMKQWYFGVDNTGNIINRTNIRGIWKECVDENKVQLVTADGSKDSSDNPNEQEAGVAEILFAEVITAFGSLRQGGCYVMEMFNLFECHTVCLIYLLTLFFDHVSISKPASSPASNAETYAVCRNFRGISMDVLNNLLKFVGQSSSGDMAMFPEQFVPANFREEMIKCSEFFTERQIESIQRNLDLEDKWTKSMNDSCRKLINKVTDEFIQ
ncbi:unnamed protein product, partial [Didymodactylos carnosus]